MPTSDPGPGAGAANRGPLDGNLADLVAAAAGRDPEHPAIVDLVSGRTVPWGVLDTAVHAEARRIVAAGVAPGDRVVVRLRTSPEFWVALFGALRAGAVVVPMSPGATGPELVRMLDDAGAVALVRAAGDTVADGAAAGRTVLEPPAPDGAAPDGAAPKPVPAVGGGEDLAVLAFTSGTSGGPRGVMLSHRALLANLEQCAALRPAPVSAADRVLLALPLFHSYGLGPGVLQVAHAAATAVLVDRFDAAQTLDAIHRHRVTAVVGVPTMYRAWLALGPERLAEATRTVRMLTSGAAPLEAGLLAGFRDAAGLTVFEGYGLTETGPVLTSTLVDGLPVPGSVGRALPGAPARGVGPVEIRLVDAEGHPLPVPVASSSSQAPGSAPDGEDDEDAGGTGFVAARGPNLFSGYWPDGRGAPGELPGLGDGWIRTGDVGYLDARGGLHLVDRADDLIIVNGFNVYPHEVEEALLAHPRVAEAAAVGVPDERSGEAVRVVLVPADEGPLSVDEVLEHCAARLARFKVPVQVVMVDALPHSPTGKLARRLLRGDPGPAPVPGARGADDSDTDLF